MMTFILCLPLYARPPKEINLEYDKDKKVLLMDIKHISKNPRSHYIRKVIIYLNEEEVGLFRYRVQKAHGIKVELGLDTKEGDLIRVEAVCNKRGKLEADLLIPLEEAILENKAYE